MSRDIEVVPLLDNQSAGLDPRQQFDNRTGGTGHAGVHCDHTGLADSLSPGDGPGASGDEHGFSVSDDVGVYFSPPDGKDSRHWVCSPLYVTAMARNAEGEEWGRLLEFPDPDARWHRWPCPLEMLAGDGTEFRRVLLSMGLRIAPGNRARALLATYVQSARVEERATSTSRTGWHSNVYVLPDEAIGDSGERVLFQSTGEPPKMRTAGTLEEWREHVGARCVGNSRLLLAASAAFGGPLVELLGDESGGVHFVGASSTGKTTALRVAASVWGGPEYVHRWRATANGLEAIASAHNDALLVLDELSQVDARDAGEVAYMLANGSGKHRARRDGRAKRATTWRLLFLSAGEIGLAAHMREGNKRARAGQEVRLADVPADAGARCGMFERLHGSDNGDALSAALRDATGKYYGQPARAFVRVLTKITHADLRAWATELRANFTRVAVPDGADGQAQRVASRFALVAAGGELATAYGMTGWSEGEAFEAAVTCYRSWLHQRGGAGSQEDTEALARVRHFLEAHGESRFSETDSVSGRPTVNRAGYVRRTAKGSQFLVFPETFRHDICAGLDYRRVARVLRDHNLLETEAPDRFTIKPRGIGRCYAISGRMLDD